VTSEWIAKQEQRRREHEHRAQARRLKLWPIESNAAHELGCACWDCILDLTCAIMRHQAEMRVQAWTRRRSLLPSHTQRRPLVPR